MKADGKLQEALEVVAGDRGGTVWFLLVLATSQAVAGRRANRLYGSDVVEISRR